MSMSRTLAIFLIGFVLGALAMHTRGASAQISGVGSIYVKQANIGAYTAPPGTAIVGFSCAANGQNDVQCYLATR